MKRVGVLVLAALFMSLGGAGGCVHCIPQTSLRFVLIDVSNGLPLAGVETILWSRNRMIGYMWFARKDGQFCLAPTKENGVLETGPLCYHQSHHFTFRKAGYQDAQAHFIPDGDFSVSRAPSDPHFRDRMRKITCEGDEAVAIRLYSADIPVVEYRPEWKRASAEELPDDVWQIANLELAQSTRRRAKAGAIQPAKTLYYSNQYDEYRVAWLWLDTDQPRYDWEGLEITADREVTARYTIGEQSSTVPTEPTWPEPLSIRKD